ncbi:MAG: histidinol dehydrogenase [Candidatus Theseobacter exili]|nr:histidinol dehydrogenase [Candidatus Theseobacter exili]
MIKIFKYTDKDFNEEVLTAEQAWVPDPSIENSAAEILAEVRKNGDAAVIAFTEKFDGVALDKDSLEVTADEIDKAYNSISGEFKDHLKAIASNIEKFQRKRIESSWECIQDGDIKVSQIERPVSRVGLYVPGGTAPLVSTVLMSAIPAKVAGVKDIIVVSPPTENGDIHPKILAACKISGVNRVFRTGGAQAIGALAYGTETIRKVDVIAGPGNAYVTAAKRQVFGIVGIDMVAGPSEILIIADDTARADYIAADMLSQAEHDSRARTFLLTPSEELAVSVQKQIDTQLSALTREETAVESIDNRSAIFQVKDLAEAVVVANKIGPEHLELVVSNPDSFIDRIQNAGAIFVGQYTPEAVGDYIAGASHVLPTNGTSRFFSALSVENFVKRINVINCSAEGLSFWEKTILEIANTEGLDAHARSVSIRRKKNEDN